MVWAGIRHDGHTQLKIVQVTLNAVKYRDDILDPIVPSFLQQWNFDHVFQRDNARCQVARVCQDSLNQNHICVLPWPALSPVMSPIEHLWDELGRRVRHHHNPPEILQELRDALVHRDDILDPIVPSFLQQWNFDHVFQRDNARCQVARVCQDSLNQNLGRHYHRLCHPLSIYGMNSVDVSATVTTHRKHYRSCVTHLCTSGTTSHKPVSND